MQLLHHGGADEKVLPIFCDRDFPYDDEMDTNVHVVSRFEANLLRLLGFFLRREPPERALPLLENQCSAPPCLRRSAVDLVRDALGKGCVQLLARGGGWRRERFLRQGRAVEGRLWERTAPHELGLTFSAHTMRFLIWITANRPDGVNRPWRASHDDLTLGDLLLLYFAHDGLCKLRPGLNATKLLEGEPFVQHALCWLAHPGDFSSVPASVRPKFAPWTNGVGACILEALQPELERRWIDVESSKTRLADPQVMLALGAAQERGLTAFLDAIEREGRMDLARFLLRSAAALLGPNARPEMWTERLHLAGWRLADRAAIYRAATTFLRTMDRLQSWERRARGIGYFEDGYAASQLWKADWEQVQGDILTERARAIVKQLDPIQEA